MVHSVCGNKTRRQNNTRLISDQVSKWLFFLAWKHERAQSQCLKETSAWWLQTGVQLKVTDASQCGEGEARVLLPRTRWPGCVSRQTRRLEPGPGPRAPRAVCRLSTYASRNTARVKYQEQLKQIEGLAVTGARAGKCTLQCTDTRINTWRRTGWDGRGDQEEDKCTGKGVVHTRPYTCAHSHTVIKNARGQMTQLCV